MLVIGVVWQGLFFRFNTKALVNYQAHNIIGIYKA